MATPFYVAPEQMMKDRADYARKGIARGRALIALEYRHGVVFVSENPSRSLHKTSEIYDRIAFAAVGRYNEFESLRVAGIRLADVKGYQYAREDVSAKPLANAYSQALGAIFMGDAKPYEVELLIAQVNGQDDPAELYHMLYDGSIVDEHGFVAIGGDTDPLTAALEERWNENLDLPQAVQVAKSSLEDVGGTTLDPSAIEVSGLDGTRSRRCFFRLRDEALAAVLAAD